MTVTVDAASHPGPETTKPRTTSRWWFLVPLGIFAVSRMVSAVLLVWSGRSQSDPTSLPTAPGRPPLESGRSYGDLIANWDGQWYRYIVEHGYPHHLPTLDGVVQQNQWAFYPLYPSLVRLLMWPGLSYAVAGSLVSLGFGAAAMCLLYRMLAPSVGGYGSAMSVLALCIAPAAVLWQAPFTESLALFLVLAALWALRNRRFGVLLLATLALALTRPIVLPLAAVAGLQWIVRWRRRAVEPFPRAEAVRSGLVIVGMVASFLLWPAIAAVATGRTDAYFATQSAWKDTSEKGWPTWLAVLGGGSNLALMVVVLVMCAVLVVVLVRRPARRWGLELRSWAGLYVLYVLASTRPTTSIFRYALLAVVPWWPFPEIGARVTARRERVALVVLVTALGILSQLAWMRWYFVIGPAAISYP